MECEDPPGRFGIQLLHGHGIDLEKRVQVPAHQQIAVRSEDHSIHELGDGLRFHLSHHHFRAVKIESDFIYGWSGQFYTEPEFSLGRSVSEGTPRP